MRFFACLLALTLVMGCARINHWKQAADADTAMFEDQGRGIFRGLNDISLKQQVRTVIGNGPSKEAARQWFAESDQSCRETLAGGSDWQRMHRGSTQTAVDQATTLLPELPLFRSALDDLPASHTKLSSLRRAVAGEAPLLRSSFFVWRL